MNTLIALGCYVVIGILGALFSGYAFVLANVVATITVATVVGSAAYNLFWSQLGSPSIVARIQAAPSLVCQRPPDSPDTTRPRSLPVRREQGGGFSASQAARRTTSKGSTRPPKYLLRKRTPRRAKKFDPLVHLPDSSPKTPGREAGHGRDKPSVSLVKSVPGHPI